MLSKGTTTNIQSQIIEKSLFAILNFPNESSRSIKHSSVDIIYMQYQTNQAQEMNVDSITKKKEVQDHIGDVCFIEKERKKRNERGSKIVQPSSSFLIF